MSINVPNQITLARLLLTGVFFVLLSLYSAQHGARDAWKLEWAFWVFLLAALSDVVDGWLARLLRQVTAFGRVVDPIVDKVMVCGAFVFFASDVFYDPGCGQNLTGVAPWMVVVILLREFTVSAIRAFSEARGVDFAARWEGKLKMFVQSATVCVVLGVLAWYPQTLAWLRAACVWLTVAVTAWSILAYLKRGAGLFLAREALTDGAAPEDPLEEPPAAPIASAPAPGGGPGR